MKATLLAPLLLFTLLASPAARARETWELCLDEGDFSFSADSFLKSARMAKSGCVFRWAEIGGKGKKYSLNVCDAFIHVERFDAIEAEQGTKLFAGSNGCPAPLFGADLDVTPGSGPAFAEVRREVFALFEAVKRSTDPKADAADLIGLKKLTQESTGPKLACAELLLDGYLNRCETYTPAPSPAGPAKAAAPEKNLPPGVHPATIR